MFPGWKNFSTESTIRQLGEDLGFVRSIGIRFDHLSAEARAVCVGFPPVPTLSSPEINAVVTETLPSNLLMQLRALELNEGGLEQLESISQNFNAIAIRLCQTLLADINDVDDEILTMGCHGAGVWNIRDSEQRNYHELCNSSLLAETFGKTVVDDFPARDLARNGIGGPVESHGLWMLLADRVSNPGYRWRGLLDVAYHATKFTMIPPLDERSRRDATFSMDICIGHRLLGELASRVEHKPIADYAKLATAGKVIRELAEIWRATAIGQETAWSPKGVSALPYLYALDQSIYKSASLDDLLATATHFIAQQAANFVLHSVSAAHPVGELFVMGEGARTNQLLMRSLGKSLPVIPIRKMDELGQDRSILAASIASLAMMNLWQIPLAPSRGGEVPRVLGRITPGSPSNWQRVLREMDSNAPWLLPLREAI